MKILLWITMCVFLTSCAKSVPQADEVFGEDGLIEESVEWGIESAVRYFTGQGISLDISGDSPEK